MGIEEKIEAKLGKSTKCRGWRLAAAALLIGMTLIGEGMGHHIPKGYVYFAMAFSVFVEMLNMRMLEKRKIIPVERRSPYGEL